MHQHSAFSNNEHVPEPRHTEVGLQGHFVLDTSRSLSIPLRFSYDVTNPFAVTMELLSDTGSLATWRFSRDLLSEGLRKPAGLGDVHIWPPCHCHGRKHVRIMLTSGRESVLIDVPAKPLRGWMRTDCLALVPAGTEKVMIDWDVELERLTSEGQ